MKSKSIRYYYFTSITTVLVASILIMGLVQTISASGYFRRQREKLLAEVTATISEKVKAGQLSLHPEAERSIEYIAQIAGATVVVTDTGGTVLQSVGVAAPAKGSQLPSPVLEPLRTTGSLRELGTLGGLYPRNFYTSGTVLTDADGSPIGFVFASSDSSDLGVYLMETMSTFILSAGAMLLVSTSLALALANRTITPVRRLSMAARRFSEGDYSARVPVEGDDELARLAITFNEMANYFEATDVSRRSFMGNIAHELRTPMTTIKGFVDGMLDGTIPVEQRDKYLAVVSDEVGRLARLTKNMLDISRLEAGEYTPQRSIFDIMVPISSVFISAEHRLLDKNIQVEGLDNQPATWVTADEDFVHQILFNLVDNAIKFANEGGRLTLTVKATKGEVWVGIKNTGQGISPEVLGHVFDRFYKADKSRGVNARGAGLGLHISKVLVGQMGGRIWAESADGEWAEFLFTLPAGQPPKRGTRRGEAKPAHPKNAKAAQDKT